jgi:hypothetical protein
MFLLNNIEILGVTQYTRKNTVFRIVSMRSGYPVFLGYLGYRRVVGQWGRVIFIFNYLGEVV